MNSKQTSIYLEEAADDSVQDVPLGFPAHSYRSDEELLALCGLRSRPMGLGGENQVK